MTWKEFWRPYVQLRVSQFKNDQSSSWSTFPVASRDMTEPAIIAIPRYERVVKKIAHKVPFGMLFCGSVKSPEMFAPAKIPVAAGKKIENTEKKS